MMSLDYLVLSCIFRRRYILGCGALFLWIDSSKINLFTMGLYPNKLVFSLEFFLCLLYFLVGFNDFLCKKGWHFSFVNLLNTHTGLTFY